MLIPEARTEKIVDKVIDQFIEHTEFGVNDVLLEGLQSDITAAITVSIEENDEDIFQYVDTYIDSIANALKQIDFYAAAQAVDDEKSKQ